MTWKEFKKLVDDALKEAGVDDAKIFYLDTHMPSIERTEASVDDDGQLTVSDAY